MEPVKIYRDGDISLSGVQASRVFIKRWQEAKMTASDHFLAASNIILGI